MVRAGRRSRAGRATRAKSMIAPSVSAMLITAIIGSATVVSQPSVTSSVRSTAAIATKINVAGTSAFQQKPISWSIRRRGSVPRVQISRKYTAPVLASRMIQLGTHWSSPQSHQPPRKNVAIKAEITSVLPSSTA